MNFNGVRIDSSIIQDQEARKALDQLKAIADTRPCLTGQSHDQYEIIKSYIIHLERQITGLRCQVENLKERQDSAYRAFYKE